MPGQGRVMGPEENPKDVEKAYKEIMALLKRKYGIQKFPPEEGFAGWFNDRQERNAKFKEALRLLFQLDAWEYF